MRGGRGLRPPFGLPGGCRGGHLSRRAQVAQDRGDRRRMRDGGQQSQPAATLGTFEHVDRECPPEQVGPWVVRRPHVRWLCRARRRLLRRRPRSRHTTARRGGRNRRAGGITCGLATALACCALAGGGICRTAFAASSYVGACIHYLPLSSPRWP